MSHFYRRSFLERSIAAVTGTWLAGASIDAQTPSASARLKALGITLPPPAAATGYVPAVQVGNLLFVSGHGPANLPDGTLPLGKVGRDLTVEQGRDSARRVGLSMLSSMQATLGSLDRVVRLVKVLGMVNVAPDFSGPHLVVGGFSDLMVEVFGKDRGTGARSAVGMAALPQNIPVEIEAVFEVRD